VRFAGLSPSRSPTGSVRGEDGIEFLDQPVKGVFEAGLVLVGMSTDEVDDLAVVIRGLFVVTTGLIDHS
jgi:hypothetical protein